MLNRRRREFEQALQLNRRDLPQWVRYADLELEAGDLASARSIYERGLAVDYTYVPLWYRYAQAEAKARNFAQARAVLERGLQLLPLEPKLYLTLLEYEEILGNVAYCGAVFEKWHATGSPAVWEPWLHFAQRHALDEDRIRSMRDQEVDGIGAGDAGSDPDAPGELAANGADPELWWLSLNEAESVDRFELAVRHCVPPNTAVKDSRWRMYALLWLRYAFFAEAQSLDAASVYERALSHYDHARLSSVTLWSSYAALLVRQRASPAQCRKLWGSALGRTRGNPAANPKIILAYIDFELKLDDFGRARKLFGILCTNWPQLATTWIAFARFEAKQTELERASALWELALGLDLDSKDSVWLEYIDYAAEFVSIDAARAIAQRALEQSEDQADMVAHVAMFELGLGMDDPDAVPDTVALTAARKVFEDWFSRVGSDVQMAVFELYTQFEESYGDNESLQKLQKRRPAPAEESGAGGVDDADIYESLGEEAASDSAASEESLSSDGESLSSDDESLDESADSSGAEGQPQPTSVPSTALARLMANAQQWKSRQDEPASD